MTPLRERPTPLTDAAWRKWVTQGGAGQLRDHASDLERKLALCREVLLKCDGNCAALHHDKDHFHGLGQPCPVESIYKTALAATEPKL